jgi:glycosyltransferase involved in cell wall biosynthesis
MKVSVILPTKDRPELVQQAIGSVVNQTFDDWELILYDVGKDGPSPPKDERVRYVRGVCRGPAADFQAALDRATGDVVTPLADDDRLTRWALGTAVEKLGDREWLCGRTLIVQDGQPVTFRGGDRDSVDLTRAGRYWLGGAVYWRKSLTDRLGGFDSSFDGAADFDLYLRFLKDSDPALTRETLYLYNDHAGTDSRVNQDRQAEASARIAAAA